MLSFLKDHPFAVEAHFESSLVFTFAIPKDEIQPLIPNCLALDCFEDQWAFLAVAMVQTKKLRPKGFPKFLGNDFFLIGYRIFVRYTTNAGKKLRGLYIIRSETDRKRMSFFGNIFTHYNYRTTDVTRLENENTVTIRSRLSDFEVTLANRAAGEISLPEGSPFSDWKEARRFAGPLPFTFTYDARTGKVLIIEGVRENWKPAPVQVKNYRFGFLEKFGFSRFVLANAFMIRDIPYFWKKGQVEIWKAKEESSRVF